MFSKQEMQMDTQHFKRCLTLTAIREMQIENNFEIPSDPSLNGCHQGGKKDRKYW